MVKTHMSNKLSNLFKIILCISRGNSNPNVMNLFVFNPTGTYHPEFRFDEKSRVNIRLEKKKPKSSRNDWDIEHVPVNVCVRFIKRFRI